MKKCIVVLGGVTALGLLLQLAVYYREGPPTWPLRPHPDFTLNVTSTPEPTPRGVVRVVTGKSSDTPVGKSNSDIRPGAHHPYRFLLNEPRACGPRTELVMVVITAINNTLDRQAVRDTWGSARNHTRQRVAVVFLVGSSLNPALQASLREESREHHDIIQEDFLDSYRNLSLKSVALLKWVTMFCNMSKYVLKTDDDMYVNVTNLLSALRRESQSHSTFVLGSVFTGAVPVQNKKSKWYTPLKQFNVSVYPRYVSGTAYSMTMSAAAKLYAATAQVPVFWLEDIYITGLCARKAGVKVYNHGGFSYQKRKLDGCLFRKAISGHRYSAQEKRTIFQKVHDPGLKC
ncbi:hypothetical protein ACOMHN_045183 [Nucella lapillus]